MGPIGMQEMALIFVLALLLFGPKKLPELGRMLAKGLTEFRRAKNELKSTFETHLQELERETRLDASATTSSTPSYSSPRYPFSFDESGHSEPDYSSPAPYQEISAASPTSTTASATAAQDAEANRESSSEHLPVAGTVSRSKGYHSVEPLSAPAKEERPS